MATFFEEGAQLLPAFLDPRLEGRVADAAAHRLVLLRPTVQIDCDQQLG